MRRLILIAALAPLPALAATELRCMPDRICITGSCDVAITEKAALRLTNPDSAAPALHSLAGIVPMAKTYQRAEHSQWSGVNAAGELEDLELDRKVMRYIHRIGSPYVAGVGQKIRYQANGYCEEK